MKKYLLKTFLFLFILFSITPITPCSATTNDPITLSHYFIGRGRYDLAFNIPEKNKFTEYVIWENGIILDTGSLKTNNDASYYVFTTTSKKPNGIYNLKVTLFNSYSSLESNSITIIMDVDDSYWVSNTYYAIGDTIDYEGILYECTLSHVSQGSWSPDLAKTLWKELSQNPH